MQHADYERFTSKENANDVCATVAMAALRRKNAHKHTLEQTSAQMLTIEREISSIETANINKETLSAMTNATKAMKTIHGGLTVDKVDQTMYVVTVTTPCLSLLNTNHASVYREDLREQHAIGEEIAEALTQGAVGAGAMDEDELNEELAELQQEELSNKMIGGTVPVGDRVDREQVSRLPGVGTGELRKGRAQQVEEDDEEEELRKLQAEMAM